MHSEQQFSPQNPTFHHIDEQVGGYVHSAPVAPFFGGTFFPPVQNQSMPFHGFNFQPSEACPRNFIICDQTDNQSQIMFHPAINRKFCYPGLNFSFPSLQDSFKRNVVNDGREDSPLKEDSDDIDALLSYENEEEEGCDDEEVSTARTSRNHQSDLLDSCSTRSSRPMKSSLPTFSPESSGNESYSRRKRRKMRKMVKALKRIVPGGNQMNTVTVLDEAVRYLKSLKVEVETIGVGNLKS